MNVERDACTPTSQGQTSVSPMMTLIFSVVVPRVSATIWRRMVSRPWPMSMEPE